MVRGLVLKARKSVQKVWWEPKSLEPLSSGASRAQSVADGNHLFVLGDEGFPTDGAFEKLSHTIVKIPSARRGVVKLP